MSVWEFSVVVVRGIPGGVWELSDQYGHVTGLHGNTILEVLSRRAPEPEMEPETEPERDGELENRDFLL